MEISSRQKIFFFFCRHFVCSTFCLFSILFLRHYVCRHFVRRHFVCRHSVLQPLNINMRSISNKFSEFYAHLEMVKSKFFFIVVTETRLKDSTNFLYEIEGYKSVSINRNDRRGGGIKIYHDESISVQILNELSGLSDTSKRLLIKAFVPNIR